MRRFLIYIVLAISVFLIGSGPAMAESPEAVRPTAISMSYADKLLGQKDVYFFDANTPDIWASGHLPGAIFINKPDWQSLLPENKAATLVFYCVNRLCYASIEAGTEAIRLGYTNVLQMPEGVYGWITSGRPVERGE